jgi:hypothetical protein
MAIVLICGFGYAAWRIWAWFLDLSSRRYEKKKGAPVSDAAGAILFWAGFGSVICWLIYGLWGLLQCSLGNQHYCSGG